MESSWKRGRSEKAKSSPAGCRVRHEYPPGYTVFECRLDGNQPIAQVVQVPPDTTGNVVQNKTCMLLETKQSESGPSSRVVAYPAYRKYARGHPSAEPMSFALESRDSPGGAVACAEKVAQRVDQRSPTRQPVTILETRKSSCRNGPSSRLMYGPISQEVAKSSETYKTPGFYIQCTTTPEGPVARVTEVPQRISHSSKDPSTNYEACVGHDGSCPRAVVTQCNKNQEIDQGGACEWLETRVDASGPRARALTLPDGSSNFRHFTHLNVCPKENGPFARITQHLGHPQEMIADSQSEGVNSSNCRCDSSTNPAIHATNPVKSFRIKRNTCPIIGNVGKRNGLSHTELEIQRCADFLKNNRIKRERAGGAPNNCGAYCSRPVSCPGQVFPACRVQPPPCASKMSPAPTRRLVSAFPISATCPCPVQQQCTASDLPFSEMRPLPGGSVVPQCPPPSLPEIAPVPLGANRLRNYKPLPKKPRPRKGLPGSPYKPKRLPKSDSKSTKPAASPDKKPKNKKTGLSGKPRQSLKTTDEGKDEELSPVSEETYVECPGVSSPAVQSVCVSERPMPVELPAFESKGNQSVCINKAAPHVESPASESKGNQAVRVNEKPTWIECPAFESKGSQSICVGKEASYVECPAFESKGNQADCLIEKPILVECPALESKRNHTVCVSDKPTYVECPAFESKGNQATDLPKDASYVEYLALKAKRKQSVRINENASYVECPAFESKGNQSVGTCEKPSYVQCPALESKRNQSVSVCMKPPYVKCPAFESKGNQSVSVCKKPSYVKCPAYESKGIQSVSVRTNPPYVKCPAFESKGNQSVLICEKPLEVDCPAFQSKENQSSPPPEKPPAYAKHFERMKSVSRFGEPEYVECPAFASRNSSETSSAYAPREETPVNKYSEYFCPKIQKTSVACSAKRYRLHNQCCAVHGPQAVLRVSYEQRRNRHARTLLSSGSRHQRFNDEANEIPRSYCEPPSKHRKHNNQEHKKGQQSVPLKTPKEDVAQNEKPGKSLVHNLPKKHKLSLKVVKSRELRAGVVYYDCDCYHRNGLQQDCPRGGCGGLKHCVNKPWPKCDLSRYFKDKWGKYGEILDLIPPTTYCGPRDALYRAKIGHRNGTKAEGKGEKLEKHQDLTKIEKNTSKPEKKARKPRNHEAHRKNSDECRKVDENMVQQYAIIPVALDDCYSPT